MGSICLGLNVLMQLKMLHVFPLSLGFQLMLINVWRREELDRFLIPEESTW